MASRDTLPACCHSACPDEGRESIRSGCSKNLNVCNGIDVTKRQMLHPLGGIVRYSLWIATILLSATTLAWSPLPQNDSAASTNQKPANDPCSLATTDETRTACWKDLARRAQFFLDPDSCETSAQQSDEARDNCKTDRAEKAEARLDAYYHSILKALRADLAKGKSASWDDTTLIAELQSIQHDWTRYRDAQCEAEIKPYDGGTVTISIRAGCKRTKSNQRLEELHDTYARYLASK
jgi:uncharacterized protein YecT (DUF1311 family)